MFQIVGGLPNVSMPPKMNACNSIEGALTVFKCVWPLVDGTLDQPGPAMQTRLRPGIRASTGVDSDWSGACAWFCVSWIVLPVSEWCRAVQCQHVTLSEHL